ncbi:hypothetical protein ACG873_11520 [Mesorhizobium sp. AaZ16]|uniref:hypothetical protein n=1 Tax=Mesorhizobium sp. AaZ16 TaxID=3402289 RepID=UPI00374FA317
MPWSSFPTPQRRAIFLGFYALAALLAGAEIVILGLALNPRVHPDYRAFYIDETTTCLNRDRIGSYSLGETISFLHLGKQREGMKRADSMKVCGWTGPTGDGTYSLGETSRLRAKIPEIPGDLAATLEMAPMVRPPQITQRVVISVNGARMHETMLSGETPRKVSFVIPQAVLAGAEALDMAFDYPDSIRQTPVASNIYDRAIKLVSFRLDVADGGATDPTSAPRTPTGGVPGD